MINIKFYLNTAITLEVYTIQYCYRHKKFHNFFFDILGSTYTDMNTSTTRKHK